MIAAGMMVLYLIVLYTTKVSSTTVGKWGKNSHVKATLLQYQSQGCIIRNKKKLISHMTFFFNVVNKMKGPIGLTNNIYFRLV